jgi:CCR4-NOT transcription complex subunit 3
MYRSHKIRRSKCRNWYQTVAFNACDGRPKYYVPRNPYQTPAFYPQAPNPVLSTAGIFSQLDVETLFYVFYFLPGTYQQYVF